jgi:flagellin-like hook-associated protein FlgL
MSDAAVSTIVNGVITVVSTIAGVVVLWLQLRRTDAKAKLAATKAAACEEKMDANAKVVETKLDVNTKLTEKIDEQTNGGLDKKLAEIASHAQRIAALEATVVGVKNKIDGVEGKVDVLGKNLDSTRHEFRGHFGTITNTLTSLTLASGKQPA